VGLGDELEDLLLARGQRLGRARGGVGHPLLHEPPLRRVGEERLAAQDGPDGVDERAVGLLLEHVAARAGLERLEQVAGIVVHGQDDHRGRALLGADGARGLQPGQARHRHVQDAQVRGRGDGLGHRLRAVAGLRDHLEALLPVEQEPQARAHDAVVVGDEQAGGHAATRACSAARRPRARWRSRGPAPRRP
jgi:hypothetical protein